MVSVSSLVVYPVKGCQGVQVEEALVLPTGALMRSFFGLIDIVCSPLKAGHRQGWVGGTIIGHPRLALNKLPANQSFHTCRTGIRQALACSSR